MTSRCIFAGRWASYGETSLKNIGGSDGVMVPTYVGTVRTLVPSLRSEEPRPWLNSRSTSDPSV